jgi:hypothetical protein
MEANSPSREKAYFEQIKSSGNGAAFLTGLIGSETPSFESEFLECKGTRDLDLSGPHVLELWAKALSGFANSGVLIFGIDQKGGRSIGSVPHFPISNVKCATDPCFGHTLSELGHVLSDHTRFSKKLGESKNFLRSTGRIELLSDIWLLISDCF